MSEPAAAPAATAVLECRRLRKTYVSGPLQVPVLLVLQWDDELVSREGGIALWDAIGSTEKTLHVNPGGHVAIPGFELESHEAFFRRHLGPVRS